MPAVFQCGMQKVLVGLNQDGKPPFVSVYLDDILVYSKAFQDYLNHLVEVISRLRNAGLKLKPIKYHFLCQKVEYLGHWITPNGTYMFLLTQLISKQFRTYLSQKVCETYILLSLIHSRIC